MYQKSTILPLLLLLACCCAAQSAGTVTQQKQKLRMNELVDLFNYHVIKFMLVNGTESESSFNNTFYSYGSKYSTNDTNYERIYNSIPAILTKTRALCSEIESLKPRLPGNLTEAELCAYLVDGMYKEKNKKSYNSNYYYPLLHDFFSKWQNEDGIKFLRFASNLKTLLLQKAGRKNSSEKETQRSENLSTDATYKNQSIFKRMTEWIVEHATLVVAALLVLLWFVAITANGKTDIKIAAVNKKIDKLAAEKSNANQQLLNERNEERLQKLEAETFAGVWAAYLELKDHTDQLTARLKLLETKQPAPEKKKETTATFQPVTTSTPADTATQRRLFFPVPDKKTGHFRAVLGKDNISGYTVYQFIIDKKEADKAVFSLIRTPQVEAAVLNFPEAYLLHACNTEGTPGINKKIGTIDTGIAQLEGDYWVIQKKALIRYV